MTIDRVKKLIQAIRTDPGAQEALEGLAGPADSDESIHCYAEAAKKLDFDVTEGEIREALAAASEEQRKKTAAAVSRVVSLADDELN